MNKIIHSHGEYRLVTHQRRETPKDDVSNTSVLNLDISEAVLLTVIGFNK